MSRVNTEYLGFWALLVFKLRVCLAMVMVGLIVLFGTRVAMIRAMAAAAVICRKAPGLADWIDRGMP